jgi:hypothetical protein
MIAMAKGSYRARARTLSCGPIDAGTEDLPPDLAAPDPDWHMTGRLTTFLAVLVTTALPAHAHAATTKSASANWAGYAVSKPGTRFRRVSATWVQPAASCAPGPRRYSAYWLGLGGYHSNSGALEQIGTQVDCSSLGEAFYSAWYELVPAGPVSIKMPVHPGDTVSASVSVSGHKARLYLANRTTGAVFSARVRAPHIDLSSAEWIVEAPSACDMTCTPLPLANFGSASFGSAGATTTSGHRGVIADPAWSRTGISLSPWAWAGDAIGSAAPRGLAAGAVPGDLSAAGDAFTVTYQDAPVPAPPVPVAPPAR